jgi:hypothetical protein
MDSLYTDLDGDKFCGPSEFIDEEYAHLFLELSKVRLDHANWFEREVAGDGYLESMTAEGLREATQKLGLGEVSYPKHPSPPPKYSK